MLLHVAVSASLREEVEGAAGRLAADLDVADVVESSASSWSEVRGCLEVVCDELDQLLTAAGAPRTAKDVPFGPST
jgi:hypothetical protein